MGMHRSSTVGILASFFALVVLSFFIVRASLNLMNQRSDLSLILGIVGVSIIILLWGLLITKLVKTMRCKQCGEPEVEITYREKEK